jgi:hypothetical protein
MLWCKLLSTECIRLLSSLSGRRLYLSLVFTLCLLSVRLFRFGLNERFGANYYRLNAFGFSPLFLVVDSFCLWCLHFVSLGAESAPLSLRTE